MRGFSWDEDPVPAAPASQQHWLLVPEDPEDDFEVEHGPNCPQERSLIDDDGPAVHYTRWMCDVGCYLDEVGLQGDFSHRDEHPDDRASGAVVLAPGRYSLHCRQWCDSTPNGTEWDSEIWVEISPGEAAVSC